jgi:hypothetical protein
MYNWMFIRTDKSGDETKHIVMADSVSSAWKGITQDLSNYTLSQTVELRFEGLAEHID